MTEAQSPWDKVLASREQKSKLELVTEERPKAEDFIEDVTLYAQRVPCINIEAKMPDVPVTPVPRQCRTFRCTMCGKTYQKQTGNFYNGGGSPIWAGNNGYVNICKECADKLYLSYVQVYSGNEEHALKRMCQLFDWCYSQKFSASTIASARANTCRLGIYAARMGTGGKTLSYVDTLRDEQRLRDKALGFTTEQVTDEDVVNTYTPSEQDVAFSVTREMVRKWGTGFTPEQYKFMEEEYADWTAKNTCNTKAHEELYKNIVLAQLDLRVARQTGGDVSKAQKALQDLMTAVNVLPKQTADNELGSSQSFGTLIKKYEDTKPIPEPSPRWADVDGITKYMNTWFRGGLAKALKLNTQCGKMFDEAQAEMKKYTVTPPSADDPNSEVADASIFDAPQEPEKKLEVVSDDNTGTTED